MVKKNYRNLVKKKKEENLVSGSVNTESPRGLLIVEKMFSR